MTCQDLTSNWRYIDLVCHSPTPNPSLHHTWFCLPLQVPTQVVRSIEIKNYNCNHLGLRLKATFWDFWLFKLALVARFFQCIWLDSIVPLHWMALSDPPKDPSTPNPTANPLWMAGNSVSFASAPSTTSVNAEEPWSSGCERWDLKTLWNGMAGMLVPFHKQPRLARTELIQLHSRDGQFWFSHICKVDKPPLDWCDASRLWGSQVFARSAIWSRRISSTCASVRFGR